MDCSWTEQGSPWSELGDTSWHYDERKSIIIIIIIIMTLQLIITIVCLLLLLGLQTLLITHSYVSKNTYFEPQYKPTIYINYKYIL
jgi:flagellar basal body-associated protein FliL